MIRLLCVGDVFGKPGREAVAALVPELIERHSIDAVIVNAENAAGGVGLTSETAAELLGLPVGMLTGGNHIWRHKEVISLLERDPRVLRPQNLPPGTPGRGFGIFQTTHGVKVGVINLLGRIFMDPVLCPFRAADDAVAELRQQTPIIVVDMHAEATSEKRALGWYLAGRVSAVFGTHTHVPTADEEILPGGTAYVTDIGMTGPYDSVIGMRKDLVIERFVSMRPTSFAAAKHDVRLCGAIFDIDPETGQAQSVQRVQQQLPPRS